MALLFAGLAAWLCAGVPLAVLVGRTIARCDATAARLGAARTLTQAP